MRFLSLFFLILPLSVAGQDNLNTTLTRRSDVYRFADGIVTTYSSPVRWKAKQWTIFGVVTLGTVGVSLLDNPVRDVMSDVSSPLLDQVNAVGNHYGKPYSAFALSSGFYATGLLFKNRWARETGLILGASLLSAGLAEMTLKPFIGRARPNEELGNQTYSRWNRSAGFHSFPSGHTTMALTMSFVMIRRTALLPIKLLFGSLAATTVFCRIYDDAHWISDVAGGAVIAWFFSDAIIKRIEVNEYKQLRRKVKWEVGPYVSGLSLKATFK